MNDSAKTQIYNSPLINGLLNEISPVEMQKTQNRMKLAANIDDLRIKNGWTKTQFAQKLGKHKSEVTKWLSGTHNLTTDILTEISFAFGIDISELYKKEIVQVNNTIHFTLEQHTGTGKNDVCMSDFFDSTRFGFSATAAKLLSSNQIM